MSDLISSFLDTFLSGTVLDVVSHGLAIVLLLLIAVIIGNVVKRVLASILKLRKGDKQTITVSRLLSSTVNFLVWFVVISMILAELEINIAPLLASAGVLGFAVGFGAQEVIKDFISGVFIIIEKTMYVGETVEIDGFKGKVIDVKLRTTSLENWLGQVKTINNGSIKTVINFSKTKSLAVVHFDVAYGTDLKQINKLMPNFLAKLKEENNSIVELPKFLGVSSLAESGITLMLIAKTKSNEQHGVERAIRQELVEFLSKNNIEIPLPQVVVTNK